MPITPQQVEFVKHFTAQGFVDAPLAYRRAYAKAANWTDPAVRSAAAETLEKPRVAYEINKARRAAALAIGDRAYVLVEGNVAHEGPAASLWHNPIIAELYLGQRKEGAR